MTDLLPILAFDVGARYGHYKKIFATTTALSYPIPLKTSLYGLFGAILGLPKAENAYLKSFAAGECRVAIQLLHPVRMQRVNINLRPSFGPLNASESRKPTLVEFIRDPKFRIFFTHRNQDLFDDLEELLRTGKSVYTPTLGLANLITKPVFVGRGTAEPFTEETMQAIESVIPRRQLLQLDAGALLESGRGNQLLDVGQYALEMLPNRDVTVRDDVILDRNGDTIFARVQNGYRISIAETTSHVVLF